MDPLEPRLPPRGVRDLRVDPAEHPGWVSGAERLPEPGEAVQTHDGPAVVVRVVGRTGGGGTLLELTMDDGRKEPFFAAAANVLVAPPGARRDKDEPAESRTDESSAGPRTDGFLV